MASISLRGVTKSFDDLHVLKGINLDVLDGEFLALVGESGCGKSTLLRVIAGLEPPSSGQIRIGTRTVNHVPASERDIAMVFQSYALYPHLNVGQNVAFPLTLRSTATRTIAHKVTAITRALGLAPLLHWRPRALSGGQRQRVAMARAIIRRPTVFLFDEPLSNLDAQMRLQMRAEIKAQHQRFGTTSIYVTHDQTEAMTLADRIVVMHQGQVQQIGPPLELYDHPINKFVAGFIGTPAMNFVPACIGIGSLNVGELLLPWAQIPGGTLGETICLGIRPEHVSINQRGLGIAATVEVVEPLGNATMLHLRVFGQRWVVWDTRRLSLQPGHTVHLQIPHQRVHLFDQVHGHRLN